MSYDVIVADPPWMESGSGKIKRGADRHYPLLATRDIAPVMLHALADEVRAEIDELKPPRFAFDPSKDSILAMWATANHLPDALDVGRALGFEYVTNAVWDKGRIGLGQYLRLEHEHLLIFKRGNPMRAIKLERVHFKHARTIRSVIREPRREHSQKPLASYQRIADLWPGARRLSMFHSGAGIVGFDHWAPMDHRNEEDET